MDPSSRSPRTQSSPHSKSRSPDLPRSRRSRPRCLRPLVDLHSLPRPHHTDSDLPFHLLHPHLHLHRTVPAGGLPSQRRTVGWAAWAGGCWTSSSFHLTSSGWSLRSPTATAVTNPGTTWCQFLGKSVVQFVFRVNMFIIHTSHSQISAKNIQYPRYFRRFLGLHLDGFQISLNLPV